MRTSNVFLCICAALVLSIPQIGADESAGFDDTPILFAVPRLNIHDDGGSTDFLGGLEAAVAWPISLRTNLTASHYFNIGGSGSTTATYNYDTYLDRATLLRGSFGIFDDEVGFGVLAHRPLLKYGMGAYMNHAHDEWQFGVMLSAPIQFGVTANGVNSAVKLCTDPDRQDEAGIRHIVTWHENVSGTGWGLHTSAAYLPTRPPTSRVSRVENTPGSMPADEDTTAVPQAASDTLETAAVSSDENVAPVTVNTPKTVTKTEAAASTGPAPQNHVSDTPIEQTQAVSSQTVDASLPAYASWSSETPVQNTAADATASTESEHDDFPSPTAGKNVSPGAAAPANDGQAATAVNAASLNAPNAAAETAHVADTPVEKPAVPAADTNATTLTPPLTPNASPGKPVEIQPRNDPLHLALLIEPDDGDAPLLLTNRSYAYVAGTIREPHTVQSLRVNAKPVEIDFDGEFVHLEKFEGPGQYNIVITATSTLGLTSQRVRKVRALHADEVEGPDKIRIITEPQQDRSLVTFTLGQGGEIPGQRIVAQLQTADGAIVQHWAQSGGGPMTVEWDGFDITHRKAPCGEYTAVFAVMVGDHVFASLRQPFVLDY